MTLCSKNKRTENVGRNMLRVYSMCISDVKQTDIECKYYCRVLSYEKYVHNGYLMAFLMNRCFVGQIIPRIAWSLSITFCALFSNIHENICTKVKINKVLQNMQS